MPSPVPRFIVQPSSSLCKHVVSQGFNDFSQLTAYIRSLPYDRNNDIDDPGCVLHEQRGTCSSKHRLLALVAHDCGHPEVQLTVGIYAMSEQNTPGVGAVLAQHTFTSIPEAHCYLTVEGDRFDFTGLLPGRSSPFDALISEHLVSPGVLPEIKRDLHLRALAGWSHGVGISLASAWAIREACIAALKSSSSTPSAANLSFP